MPTRSPLFIAAIVAGCASQPSQRPLFEIGEATAPHEQCTELEGNGGDDGCYLGTRINLGPMPSQLYWHIDRFADRDAAEAARTLHGSVTVAFGNQILLQTINDNPGWRPAEGDHLATIGPLAVAAGPDLTAWLMEASTSDSSIALPSVRSGPEAIYQLSGTSCIETPQGVRKLADHESLVIPQDTPLELHRDGHTVGRSLILVIHPTSQPWTDGKPAWVPKLLCE